MAKIFFLWILPLFLFHSSCAQVVWEGNKKNESIARYIYVLEDKEGKLDIGEVSSGKYDSSFYLTGKHLLNFGFTESTYWLRFNFANNNHDSLLLEIAHAFIPYADLYYRSDEGNWTIVESGYKVNLKNKVIKDHHQIFPLPPGKRELYLRIVPYLHPVIINVWEKNAYELNANKQRMIYGFYVGILFFAIIINFFLFVSLKKNYYLQYAILVLLYTAASAGVMEGYLIYFFPEADMMYWYKLIPVLNMPALLFYCMSFLELRKVSVMIYRTTLFTAIALILYIMLLHFSPLMPYLMINQIFSLIVFILTIFLGVFVGKKGNRLGYYFAITYGIWFVLLCFEEIYIQFGIPKHIFELSYVSVAIFVEAFLLAFLLAKRFQWDRKADELSKLEMQRNIAEIQQRFQHEIMLAQLEMQEQTFQNISQEIHDNIGQTLSLIKINLNMVDHKITSPEKERLSDSKVLLSKVIQELRDLTKMTSADYIQDIGLVTAIEQQVNLIRKTGKYEIDFSVRGKVNVLDLQKELLIFRIIQELFNNTIKHSKADRITISMQYNSDNIVIKFTDNGVGFDQKRLEKEKTNGLGLRNIINRTELIGGQIIIDSTPMNGIKIILTVPN